MRLHRRVVDHERNGEAHKPGVVIKNANRRNCQPHQRGPGSERERNHCASVETFEILVTPAAKIQVVHLQNTMSNQEIVADHDASDGS